MEKEIDGILNSGFIALNLAKILDDANESYRGILKKGHDQGMNTIDEQSDR